MKLTIQTTAALTFTAAASGKALEVELPADATISLGGSGPFTQEQIGAMTYAFETEQELAAEQKADPNPEPASYG